MTSTRSGAEWRGYVLRTVHLLRHAKARGWTLTPETQRAIDALTEEGVLIEDERGWYKASCAECDRPSCRPPEYHPLCSRHYLLHVRDQEKAARDRFQAHLTEVLAARGITC